MTTSKSRRVWTVADAQANLPEVLRRAETEGPQYIGSNKTFVVTPAEPAQIPDEPELTLGQWLVKNARPGGQISLCRTTNPSKTKTHGLMKTTDDRVRTGHQRSIRTDQ